MITIGTLLWCLFTTADIWVGLRYGDPTWVLLLRALWALGTVVLIASGDGAAFFIANTLLGICSLTLTSLSLLVMPPPLARDLARAILSTCLGILIAALCWALN